MAGLNDIRDHGYWLGAQRVGQAKKSLGGLMRGREHVFSGGRAEFTLDEFCAGEDCRKLWGDKGLENFKKST